MKKCKTIQAQFVDAMYRQLSADDLQAFEAHLQSCAACCSAFEKFRATGELLSLKTRQEPEPAFWDHFENQVMQQVFPAKRPTQSRAFDWRIFFTGWRLQLAGSLAMLLIGIFLGYLFFGGHVSPQLTPETAAPTTPVVQTQALDYLERSRILLLGMVNLDAAPGELNFTHQKQISRELLQEAAELKPQLSHAENLQLQELIGKLEMILLQIANYEKQFDLPAISLISSGIENQSLLLKINIEEMRLTNRLQQSAQNQKSKL